MSAGELSDPGGKDAIYTPGYVTSYEHFNLNGTPKVFPALNAKSLNAGDLVSFEVIGTTLNDGEDMLFIPVAKINLSSIEKGETLLVYDKNADPTNPVQSEKLMNRWNEDWDKIKKPTPKNDAGNSKIDSGVEPKDPGVITPIDPAPLTILNLNENWNRPNKVKSAQ